MITSHLVEPYQEKMNSIFLEKCNIEAMRRYWAFVVAMSGGFALAGGASGPSDAVAPLIQFLRQQPKDVALTIAEVSKDGGGLKPLLVWNAEQPQPLASSRKIVVLAAYAQAVAAGRLNPQEQIGLADWEKYYLPGLDGGAHADSLKALNIAVTAEGKAKTPALKVPLDVLARFMIETSDNAATDYLMVRLGQTALQDTVTSLKMSQQEPFGPFAGLFSLWYDTGYAAFEKKPLSERTTAVWERANLVARSSQMRQSKTLEAKAPPLGVAWQQPVYTDARGTTQDYTAVMARVLSGEGFNPAELAVMRRHLGWPMHVYPQNRAKFNSLYAKGGSLPGVVTENMAFELKDGRRYVYSLFLKEIPVNQYEKLLSTHQVAMLQTLLDAKSQGYLVKTLQDINQ